MSTPQFPPHGVYGAARDGLGDPQKASVEDRQHKATTRLTEERTDSELMSPMIRTLRASSAAALADAAKPRPAVKAKPVFVKSRDAAKKG
jgi:hypothetical protein